MSEVGKQAHTDHGLGTITEIDSVRGSRQFRVAGRGFDVWVPEIRLRLATGDYIAGLETTIDQGDVNDDNSTTLPYDPSPQYPVDLFRKDQTILPGDYEIDPDDRLRSSDSLSKNRADANRPYPGPNPDLFAKGASYHYAETLHQADGGLGPGEPAPYLPGINAPGVPGYSGDPLQGGPTNPSPRSAPQLPPGGPLEGAPTSRPGGPPPAPPASPPGRIDRPGAPPLPGGRLPGGAPGIGEGGSLSRPGMGGGGLSGGGAAVGGGGGMGNIPGGGPKNLARPGHRLYAEFEDEPSCPEWGEDDWHSDLPDGPERTFDASYSRPDNLSDRYAYIIEPDDPRDPITAFRRDPVEFMQRRAYVMTAGEEDHLFKKFADYDGLLESDPQLRTAAWADVRQKAQRLRHEGKVHVNHVTPQHIYATVSGDNGTYDTMIIKGASGAFSGGQAIANWSCDCDWGKWAFQRKVSYVGRLCSHAYAAYLDMQSHYQKDNQGRFRAASIVDNFKSWAKENNDGHLDRGAMTDFINTCDHHVTKEEAEALYDHLLKNVQTAPERDYDVPYTFDNDEAYKTAADTDALRQRPLSLTPDLRQVPKGEENQWTDVTEDDRKTTGPDQIVHFSALAHKLHSAAGPESVKTVLNSSLLDPMTAALHRTGDDSLEGTGFNFLPQVHFDRGAPTFLPKSWRDFMNTPHDLPGAPKPGTSWQQRADSAFGGNYFQTHEGPLAPGNNPAPTPAVPAAAIQPAPTPTAPIEGQTPSGPPSPKPVGPAPGGAPAAQPPAVQPPGAPPGGGGGNEPWKARGVSGTPGGAGGAITDNRYNIQRGDTLNDIATRSGLSVQDIMNANRGGNGTNIVDPNKINAGDTLNLPGASGVSPGQGTKPAQADAAPGQPATGDNFAGGGAFRDQDKARTSPAQPAPAIAGDTSSRPGGTPATTSLKDLPGGPLPTPGAPLPGPTPGTRDVDIPKLPTPPAGQLPPVPGDTSKKAGSWTSRLHYAENDDDEPRPDTGKAADMLQRLRTLSEENPSDHYQHMDDHNDEIRELVEKLNDAGVDAMPFVAHRLAAEDERKSSEAMDGNPDFAGISSPGWADEPFNGSGPDPQLWSSDSASWVDEHERPDFTDVTDLPDGDIIKFNDSRSAPQQGPRHGSRYYADGPATLGDYSNMDGFDPGSYTDGDSALGGDNTVMASYHYADDDGYVGDGMASGYFNPDNPTGEDWEEGSGTPFLHQLEHSSDEMDPTSQLTGGGKGGEAGEGAAAGEEGGGAAELLAENPELLALAASRHSPRGGFSVEAFDRGGFSYDDGGPLRAAHRVGGGPTQQVRVDRGARGWQRQGETYSPPEDFGYDGETAAYGEPSADPGMSADIVANFQRSASALEMMHSGSGPARPGSIDDFGSSPMVQSMLRKTAGRKYSPEEQRMLEAENHPLGARNLPSDEDLAGTHYLLG